MLAFFTAGVLILALAAVARNTWLARYPHDLDLYRDIAQASAVRRGRVFSDWSYAGERPWYTPLGSWLIALVSWVTGTSVTSVVVRAGLVVNLLTPIALVVACRRWFGVSAAAFALVGYMFILGDTETPWATAAYSPWLFQSIGVQALFLMGVLSLTSPAPAASRRNLAVGVALGVVALGHLAPALVLTLVVLSDTLRKRKSELTQWRATAGRLTAIGGVALVVTSPFWIPVFATSGFHMQNPLPSDFTWGPLSGANLVRFALEWVGRWQVVLGLVGLGTLGVEHRRSTNRLCGAAGVVASWTILSASLLTLGLLAGSTVPVFRSLPTVVPPHHFLLSLTLSLCAWWGLGMAALLRAIASRLRMTSTTPIMVGGLVAITVFSMWQWNGRSVTQTSLDTSRYIGEATNHFSGAEFVSRATPSSSVILSGLTGDLGYMFDTLDNRIGVVVENPYFSSPYVDWQQRRNDADAMLAAVAACDRSDFDLVANRYDVTHVVTPASGPLFDAAMDCDFLKERHHDTYSSVLEVTP